MPRTNPTRYKTINIDSHNIIHHKAPSLSRPNTGPSENWKIVIPTSLVQKTLNFYHHILRHPGSSRMYFTIARHFYFPNMKQLIEDHVKTCDVCQRIKPITTKLGQLPEKLAESNPFEEIQTDLIGPWDFIFPPNFNITIKAITTIDPFLGIAEIRRIKNKTSAHVATKFYEMWICLLYTSPSPRDRTRSRMPSSA